MTSLAQSRHVLVIGAGVVGYACALALLARGWRVTLTDPDRAGLAASWGNAGHIATEQVEPLASLAMLRSAARRHYAFGGALDIRNPVQLAPWILRYLKACAPRRFEAGREALRDLMADALPAWRRLVAAVQAPQLLRETGHWVCWESAGSAQRGRRGWRGADTGTACFADLVDDQLESLRTHLRASLAGGIAFEGTAQIADPVALSDALAAQFARNGGERRFDRIDALADQNGRVHARTADGTTLVADALLVCAGVRSRELMASVGVAAPLVAERGYHLQWRDHEWPDLPPVVFEDRSMIITRFESGLRAASFVEYAAVDAPPDPDKWRRLHQHVRQLGIPVHGEPVQWFGARPTLPDYLPALGRSARFGNLYYAFGHQHLGLTLAAITGEMIGDLMAGDGAPGSAAFAIERFGR